MVQYAHHSGAVLLLQSPVPAINCLQDTFNRHPSPLQQQRCWLLLAHTPSNATSEASQAELLQKLAELQSENDKLKSELMKLRTAAASGQGAASAAAAAAKALAGAAAAAVEGAAKVLEGPPKAPAAGSAGTEAFMVRHAGGEGECSPT